MAIKTEKIKLSEKEIKAFVDLLKDDDNKILSLMAEQLGKFDDTSLSAIEEFTFNQDNEQLMDNWYSISKQNIIKEIKSWKKKKDLEEGLFLLARFKNPGLLIHKYKAILDSYAERISRRIRTDSKPEEIIEAMNSVLFREETFVGNQCDYYDINNNFIHTVLEQRTGNPIMISSIFILVGRRLGLDIKGVGTPGHFIVKFADVYYDPFFLGREVHREECVIRAQELGVHWRNEFLEPIDDAFIVSRSIRNIISTYKKMNDLDKAEDITRILKLV
jgi:regulator of sirC expression with transglutaminase-like and TPR domain